MPQSAIQHLDREKLALAIRQPWAELILRGIKTLEVRTLPTQARGPIYLYTSQKLSEDPATVRAMKLHSLTAAELPLGVVVGTVEITGCRQSTPADAVAACLSRELLADYGGFVWDLTNPQRLAKPVRPRFLPYGIWFYPFRRKGNGGRMKDEG